jgi:YHS domain-containing protein
MKFHRIIPLLLFSIFIISSSFAQQDNMMKKDDTNGNMNMENKGMKNDSMMMNNEMKSSNMMGKNVMKKEMKDKMDMNKDKMKSDNMMKNEMMVKIYKDKNNVAINGYDPVAYFTNRKSEKGEKKYSYKWNGAEWYFVNRSHMEMFKKNPEKYSPQYGGFCAFGVTKNKLVSSDPNVWQIVNGKLYLCHTKEVHKLWEKDQENNIKRGDKIYPKLNSNM